MYIHYNLCPQEKMVYPSNEQNTLKSKRIVEEHE